MISVADTLFSRSLSILWFVLCLLSAGAAGAVQEDKEDLDAFEFDDAPLAEPIEKHPDWFKLSFLDLAVDLEEARENGKKGLVLYFGQRRCAYCRQLMEVDFGDPDIAAYTRKHFDVVAIDIFGERIVTDFQGRRLTEREYSVREKNQFTPTLVFYDLEGKVALKLPGFYPPYQFRAALEFVVGGHYKQESFRDYLARGEGSFSFEEGGLNDEDFFSPPPYILDRSRFPGERPLVVLFEQGNCHACNVLHSGPLRDPVIRGLMSRYDVVQLDMWADTPVITPAGQRTTAKKWADQLGLFYAPTLLFFDKNGWEVLRVDSVVMFMRLRAALEYVVETGYEEERSVLRWYLKHTEK
jgi:thioredoxin-related protein